MKSDVSLYPEDLADLDQIEAVPVTIRTGYAATSDTTLSTCSATDANGNPHNGVFSYARYTAVSTNGVATERNGFDALGRRVWSWDGTTTNYFVWSGQQILADVNSTGGLVRSYVWAGVDHLLAFTTYTGATAKTYFCLNDAQGTVHALADETGAIVESYRFDAWGRVLGIYNGSGQPLTESAVGNRFLWQGKQYSFRTGFYQNRARVYDPITGRFLSKDPLGISGGMNEYTYAGNNPVNFVDWTGLCTGSDDGWYGWWDRLAAWSRNNVNESYNATSGLGWIGQGTLLTMMEMGNGLASFPSAIGHLGEGSGTFAGDPTLENSAGVFQDISTVASVGALAGSGIPSVRTPFGRTPAGRPYTQHYGTETGPERGLPGSVVDNTINVGQQTSSGGKTVYYDSGNNVTVVVGRRGIVSARRGAP